MSMSLSRLFRARTGPDGEPARLWLRPGAEPITLHEISLHAILEQEGPMPQKKLVNALAEKIRTDEPNSASLDSGIWGPAVAFAEADRAVRSGVGRFLIEMR